ncbi:hypothetical protein BCIN_01g11470 [Botrytis cinerea B05.10]|uniref:Lccl domain-containing protein n=2 Tax=Botryotinia fuckeliana TaxID=40559 RepID=A0A384J797_BOTFB|nr:hypothetical protein BCIN_01g11470 [Botrytis cinerea B05.10]XP_024546761.1 hypothetical protein BCIN_01g11470 [Botrytis cinerea B05.10]ATZ46577.1 hypothetical protein BCIN_01g11470 [Botrytis cinerea B05.10]ATZ46578.1 hypothetical protein BCIN_01g11470 [Botrytis cinerea B05.10]EMR90895.1 putative lccl domain-containing protein [Botrytis cinerea BcDW1]
MSQTAVATTTGAVPPTVTVDNISGRWSMNLQLSDSYDSILKIQGVNWLTRKVLNVGTISLKITQTISPLDSLTHLDIESKSGAGLPGSVENRILNDETRSKKHPLFGNVVGRTRWAELSDLPSKYLGEGWEEGTKKVVLMTTEHTDIGATTWQAGGIEKEMNGERRYVRRVEVRKGEEVLMARIVYDYLGPLEE